jgi:hypothetical protein
MPHLAASAVFALTGSGFIPAVSRGMQHIEAMRFPWGLAGRPPSKCLRDRHCLAPEPRDDCFGSKADIGDATCCAAATATGQKRRVVFASCSEPGTH